MNTYITGAIIRKFREEKKMTQLELGEKLHVSDKAVSKWETGKGYPDISLLEPLADALGISAIELLSGKNITNTNRSCNMSKLRFYACPVCGNILTATGEAVLSCCGVTLPPLEAEASDAEHTPDIERIEDEYYIAFDHEMSRTHYISFIAGVQDNGVELVKLYPEGAADARIKIRRTRHIYAYCNRDGLFRIK